MTRLGFASDLLRPDDERAHRVTYVELFFDLVFVFAITQISHILIHHQGGSDLVHTVMITLVVWWVWVTTTWAANWLNPERGPVRALLIAMMVIGLVMAAAIPEAFAGRTLLFVIAMVLMKLVCGVFTALAFARRQPDHAVNFVRICGWHAASAVLWVTGALLGAPALLWIWLAALLIDYAGPRVRFWMPGLGASSLSTWNVSGEHMAERVSLFFIIVLGESIIVTGSTFGTGDLDAARSLAFLAAFLGTVLLWLLYFTHGERGGSDYLSQAAERGLIAQVAYTYVPVVMVIGVVLSAVADDLVLRHPLGGSDVWTAALVCGAPAAYILGYSLFKRAVGGPWLAAHGVGIAALAVLFLVHPVLSPLALIWLSAAVLLAVVIADEIGWRRRYA